MDLPEDLVSFLRTSAGLPLPRSPSFGVPALDPPHMTGMTPKKIHETVTMSKFVAHLFADVLVKPRIVDVGAGQVRTPLGHQIKIEVLMFPRGICPVLSRHHPITFEFLPLIPTNIKPVARFGAATMQERCAKKLGLKLRHHKRLRL